MYSNDRILLLESADRLCYAYTKLYFEMLLLYIPAVHYSKCALTFATSHRCSSRQKSSGPTPTPWNVSRRRNRSRIVRSQNAGACSLLQSAFMSLGFVCALYSSVPFG